METVTDLEDTLVMIADCETTGVEAPIGVVEIAWQLLDWDLNLLSKFDTLVNPEMHIPEDVTGLHGALV